MAATLISLDDVKIKFHNFAGGPLPWDPNNTKKTLTILVSDEQVETLQKAGVTSVKPGYINPNYPDAEPENRLPINIQYNTDRATGAKWGPSVHMYIEGDPVPVELTEDTIGQLDDAYILKTSVVLSLHKWSVNGKSGANVYLKELYVVIRKNRYADEFAKYSSASAGSPDSGADELALNVKSDKLPF